MTEQLTRNQTSVQYIDGNEIARKKRRGITFSVLCVLYCILLSYVCERECCVVVLCCVGVPRRAQPLDRKRTQPHTTFSVGIVSGIVLV